MALVAGVLVAMNLKRRVPRPMMSESCRWVPFLSIPGVFAFLGGMALLVCNPGKFKTSGLTLLGAGLLAGAGSIVLNSLTAKARRSAWPLVQARCIGRTLEKHRLARSKSRDVDAWMWRLVCEMNFAGKNYRVNPRIQWSDLSQTESPFRSESKAQAFIETAVSQNGACRLRVNPQNPQEAELLS